MVESYEGFAYDLPQFRTSDNSILQLIHYFKIQFSKTEFTIKK